MEAIVFIGTYKSGSSREGIKAAKQLGYYTILITPNRYHLRQRNKFKEVDKMIYLKHSMDYGYLLNCCKRIQKQGIKIRLCISFIDPYVYLAAKLSENLGLAEPSTEALFLMEDKTRFREALKSHPSTPFYAIYNGDISIEKCFKECQRYFPVVLKPPVSNGSKNVFLIETKEEFLNKMKFLLNKYNSPILIEEFVSGTQYIVEVIAFKGRISITAIIEQEINKNFVVTGYSYPAIMNQEDKKSLVGSVKSIVSDLGVYTATCHLEMRNHNGEWKLIEINPRMSGGAMNEIIKEGSGINLAKETLKVYLGIEPNLEIINAKYVYAHFITVNKSGRLIKVTGRIRASRHTGVKKVYVGPRKGSFLSPPTSMGNRYAYVIASSSRPRLAKSIALKAAREIKLHLKPIK